MKPYPIISRIWTILVVLIAVTACTSPQPPTPTPSPLSPTLTPPPVLSPLSPPPTPTSEISPLSPPPTPEDTATIPWNEARSRILNGEVSQIVQAHSLQVTLYLKNGRQLITEEPTIDEVFRIIQECGVPCRDIVQATE